MHHLGWENPRGAVLRQVEHNLAKQDPRSVVLGGLNSANSSLNAKRIDFLLSNIRSPASSPWEIELFRKMHPVCALGASDRISIRRLGSSFSGSALRATTFRSGSPDLLLWLRSEMEGLGGGFYGGPTSVPLLIHLECFPA